MAVGHRIRLTTNREQLFLSVERRLETPVRRTPGAACQRSRNWTGRNHHRRSRQCWVARSARSCHTSGRPAGFPAALHAGTSARRDPLGPRRRAHRQPIARYPHRTRRPRRKAERPSDNPNRPNKKPHRIQLVVQNLKPELIPRIWYNSLMKKRICPRTDFRFSVRCLNSPEEQFGFHTTEARP